MPEYVAFLRAINVGGHNVKMEQLRQLFRDLKFSDVETFIASGNVIFESPSRSTATLEKEIEKHLQAALGYEVKTFLRTCQQVRNLALYEPFADFRYNEKQYSLYVSFLSEKIGQTAKENVLALHSEDNKFEFHGKELFWLCRGTLSKSSISGPRLDKALAAASTMRNVTTLRKLSAKYCET